MRPHPWLAAALMLGAMLATSACDIDTAPPGTSERATTLPERTRTIARLIGLPLPATAQPRYARYQSGIDDNARLILTMSAADWATMRARPPLSAIEPTRYSASDVSSLQANEGEWDPESRPGLVAAQMSTKHARVFNVGFVDTGPNEVLVYVFWYQT